MDWNEKLQNIVDYVENHLQREEEPIDYDEVARLAGCSYGFFQKVFSYMNGISFSDYVRYRKLTLAGYDIKSTEMKIVDISYRYGYESPTSFTKAFKMFHKVTPQQARSNKYDLEVVPKMQIVSKQKFTWRVEEKVSLHLVGISTELSNYDHNYYQQIPKIWHDLQKSSTYKKLIDLDTASNKGMFGFCYDYYEKTAKAKYNIMVISDKEIPEGFIELTIPRVTWAIFDCVGAIPNSIQDGWRYLNEEWIIKYPFRHDKYPDFEWYSDGSQYDRAYLSQIWIPILREE